MPVTREQIEEHVLQVVAEEDLAQWWGLFIPALGMTAALALWLKPDELLAHVQGYGDPSFT